MNSLVRVFSNFKEFYSEINGATLTGAIDVIVVEQPDGEFLCSPFHVRFGKLGVLRSREKIVDIEINGEPIDIHMKLGDSGEAFFVEECPEEEIEELPENLATSPIPTNEFDKYEESKVYNQNTTTDEIILPLPIPRRNSIDFSKECKEEITEKKFENQISDFSHRRHTDNAVERRDLSSKKKEYTTQKIRQQWAEHEEQLFQLESKEKTKDWRNSTLKDTDEPKLYNASEHIATEREESKNVKSGEPEFATTKDDTNSCKDNANRDDGKSKKRRRKKSQMKKKNAQRKSSSSSSLGSIQLENADIVEPDAISNNTGSSNDETSINVMPTVNADPNMIIVSAESGKDNLQHHIAVKISKDSPTIMKEEKDAISASATTSPNRIRDLDIHFFSDTEVGSGLSPRTSRPSTPIQSDSELELSRCEKPSPDDIMTNSASWKWGELPETSPQTSDNGKQESASQSAQQRNSMLSGMFSFMKRTNKLRKNANEVGGIYLSELDAEGMDPEMAALYLPTINAGNSKNLNMHHLKDKEDDQESGNGTSLPHSPSSIEGGPKSLDSDFEEGKTSDKYLDFVAMSLCGGSDKNISDEDFDRHLVKYSDVCENPAIFSSPNLIVRLNGKYYNWSVACPIVMTIITFQKPLSNDAINQLITMSKHGNDGVPHKSVDPAIAPTNSQEAKRGYSWWYWRRSGGDKRDSKDNTDNKLDPDQIAVATQTSRSSSPEKHGKFEKDKSFEESLTSSKLINISQDSTSSKGEKYRKSLRLSSDAIKKLNLKPGMNEIEFSVTTAYQGTSRAKCYLFRWKHSDKVVISDIDGTITKSDVLGHILPMVGKDWAQIGVAQLFSKIEANGYKLLYLSARAIGQARVTREYLRSIRQGDVKLPDGPLLLNPTSLISAFHREVIERKPEQFKIACLSDIQALFPEKNPFYAGYGNRINDVWAYRAVGIPIMRIFTINTKGELKHELTQTFQSSYCSMTYIVDQLFPPIKDDEGTIEFSNFNYWRDPIPELNLEINTSATNITNVAGGPNGGTSTATNTTIPNNSNLNNTNSSNMNTTVTNPDIQSQIMKPLATIPEN